MAEENQKKKEAELGKDTRRDVMPSERRPEVQKNIPESAVNPENTQNVINEPGKSVTPVKEKKNIYRKEESNGGEV